MAVKRRNGGNFELCRELLKSGVLGKLQTLYANVGPSVNWPPLPSRDWLAAEELPPRQVLDWDRWLGPAPWRPYNSTYVSGGWRNFYDFHGGGILEWGSHTVDLCQWAADLDDTQPVEYEPVGTNVGPYKVLCRYATGVNLVMCDDGWDGSLKTGSCSFRIEGDKGWVETGDATRIECSDNVKPLLRPTTPANLALASHMAIGVINSIGKRRDAKAGPALAKMIYDADDDVARAAAGALGKISGVSSMQELQAALVKMKGMTRMAVADASLVCAEHRLTEGKRAQALALYASLSAPDMPKSARLAAMHGIIREETSTSRPR